MKSVDDATKKWLTINYLIHIICGGESIEKTTYIAPSACVPAFLYVLYNRACTTSNIWRRTIFEGKRYRFAAIGGDSADTT